MTPKEPTSRSKADVGKLDSRQQFAVDAVRLAVALPQSDPQDRLRVLVSASNVIGPIKPGMARQFSKEGLQIEQEMILRGDAPAESMLTTGAVDCAAVQSLVESVSSDRLATAEQTLIAAISRCSGAVPTVRRKAEQAMENRVIAPRLSMALMEKAGPNSLWSQQHFEELFSSLPDPKTVESEAPNFAAMYARMAPVVDQDGAMRTGLRLLIWIGKLNEGSARAMALNVTTGAMRQTLGEDNYKKALESDVMARQVAQAAGQPSEVERAPEESVSVLQAMSQKAIDHIAELGELPPSQRAREAAASGFASGTSGNRKMADRYFDVAFSSLDEVWRGRGQMKDAPAVVQEVSEAAAQVDAVNALQRAQRLQDPAAQAIGMISVARVVASTGTARQPAK